MVCEFRAKAFWESSLEVQIEGLRFMVCAFRIMGQEGVRDFREVRIWGLHD